MSNNGIRGRARWRRLAGLFRGPPGGALLLILIVSASAWLRTSDAPASVSLWATRFDLVRLEREELEALPASVRGILLHSDPPEIPVSSIAEAARRAEFEPRLPQSDGAGQALPSPKLSIVSPIRTNRTIRARELRAALEKIQETDLRVPPAWDGTSLEVNISAGIVADYDRMRLGQRLPLEFRVPIEFPVDRFLEVLFRIGGLSAADTTALSKRFDGRPTEFLFTGPRFPIEPREVQLASGPAVRVRFLSDDGIERLTLAWNARDRVYFLSGQLTEVEAIAIANSVR